MKKIVLLALVLSACATGASGPDTDGAWQLTAGTYDGSPIPIPPSHPITMALDGDEVGGTAACNGYGGTLQIGAGGRFSLGSVAITEMACMPIGVMEAEQMFVAALLDADHIALSDDVLSLTGPDTEMAFTLLPPVPTADLIGTTWVLDALLAGDAVTSVGGDPATLHLFDDGTFTGSTGCRRIAGSYIVTGAEVQLTNFGTEGECGGELASQDSHVVSVLEGGFRVEIEGDRLTILVPGDEGLTYQAQS